MESQAPGGVPAQTELVIGFVAAVGIDLRAIVTTLRSVLSEFDYRCHDLHLTDQLRALDWDVDLEESPYDERVWSYMTAGNRLRGAWERDDAFALLAINAISVEREKLTGNTEVPADRQAYLLRSLKRTEEARLLRDVYGSRFVLLSIYSRHENGV